MKTKILLIIGLLSIMLTGCADTVTFTQAIQTEPVGFWFGAWHGMIFPFAWICSLISDASIYAIYNNGGWYDFGYFLGIGGFSTSVMNRFK